MTAIPVNFDLWGSPVIPEPDQKLAALYQQTGRTLDDLPYTDEFDRLFNAVQAELPGESFAATKRSLFDRLLTLRKRAVLPRLGRGWSDAIKLDSAQEARLAELVVGKIGRLALRDRLPYTREFDQIGEAFNRARSDERRISHHDLWRIICRLAK
ncbi:MAG: hypothetical protein U0575_06455 [Phycisphaerales bacterium]|jgi:hypothetical protein